MDEGVFGSGLVWNLSPEISLDNVVLLFYQWD